MRYGHPQQTQIVGCVPIGVGLMTASFTGEVLTPTRTKAATTQATLARVVRRHDLPGVGLVRDECPKLKKAPARVVPTDRLRNGRSATDAGQVFEADPRTHRDRFAGDELNDEKDMNVWWRVILPVSA